MTLARRALLPILAVPLVLLLAPASARAQEAPPYRRAALVLLVPGVSFEQLLSIPSVRQLARRGGAGLLANADDFTVPRVPAVPAERFVQPREDFVVIDPRRVGGLPGVGEEIARRVSGFPAQDLLVMVADLDPSAGMARRGDALPPLVMAGGPPAALLTADGPVRALTSDSTRRTGVVAGVDIQTTLVDHLTAGGAAPASGSVIRPVDEPAPFELHRKYLAMRRSWFPIQTAAALYVTVVGLIGVAVFLLGSRVPRGIRRFAGWLALSVVPLSTALLAAGHLPSLSYAMVVPFVIGIAVAGVLLVVPLQRFGTSMPTAALGVAVLVYFAAEAAIGWSAALTPFLGGSELDGGRFFGLPNVFIGLLIGASLFAAVRLPTGWGFGLIAVVGLLAGLPWVGSNLGAAVSLFAAAGLWFVVRTPPRPGWQRLGIAAGVVATGTGLVLVAHRYLTSAPTHVTRFEEASGGLGGAWGAFVDRLDVGWRLIEGNPFALVPVIGLVATLAVVLWPPRRVRAGLEAAPVLATAIAVTLVAGVVAYVANDTGPAAAGLAFGLGLGGLLYVLLAPRTGMIEAP